VQISVNGRWHSVDVDSEKPLVWVLREDLGLNGTKYGCGIGVCGTCKVLVDRRVVSSCSISAATVRGKEIVTIEGLHDLLAQAIKRAWILEQVSQCGYCQPCQVVSAYALLSENPHPSDEDIAAKMTTLCRCGTYQRIRSAIQASSQHNMQPE
jgi:isoquinoline 1-oxidoreductase alpha subunit